MTIKAIYRSRFPERLLRMQYNKNLPEIQKKKDLLSLGNLFIPL
jgi:hypothetical protein